MDTGIHPSKVTSHLNKCLNYNHSTQPNPGSILVFRRKAAPWRRYNQIHTTAHLSHGHADHGDTGHCPIPPRDTGQRPILNEWDTGHRPIPH
eukprot:gene1611-4131_t